MLLTKEQVEKVKELHTIQANQIMSEKQYGSDLEDWGVSVHKLDDGWYVSGALNRDPNGLQMEVDALTEEPGTFHAKTLEILDYCYNNYLQDCCDSDDLDEITESNYHLRNLMVFLLLMEQHFGTTQYTIKQMYDLFEWDGFND